MQTLVDYIVKALVTSPDKVEVQQAETEGEIHLAVSVLPEDVGLVIGKRGYVIRAIRQLANVIAAQEKKKVYVEVLPQEG